MKHDSEQTDMVETPVGALIREVQRSGQSRQSSYTRNPAGKGKGTKGLCSLVVEGQSSVQNQVSRRAEVQARQAVLQVRDRRGSRGLEKAEWSGRQGSKHKGKTTVVKRQARVRNTEASRRGQKAKQNQTEPGRQN